MTVQELLKPRKKCKADYPGNPFEVGEILTDMDGNGIFIGEVERSMATKSELDLFPHLFVDMAWYEEREALDMPKHIKGHDGKVYEVSMYRIEPPKVIARIMDDFWKTEVWQEVGEPFWKPSTETEYNEYLKTKKA